MVGGVSDLASALERKTSLDSLFGSDSSRSRRSSLTGSCCSRSHRSSLIGSCSTRRKRSSLVQIGTGHAQLTGPRRRSCCDLASLSRSRASEVDGSLRSLVAREVDGSVLLRVTSLGAGQFGCVSLVTDGRGTPYALKALWKGQLLASDGVGAVVRERDLLASVSHPAVVQLAASFQDARRVFLLLEPALGGELFALIHMLGRFDEHHARFYAASVADVLGHLHDECGIVYRDLKPENLLLDGAGHIKLCDFGLAKRLRAGCGCVRTTTICGTPEYLAPEMVRGEAYGVAVDWWALGLLLFEMLSGVPAYRADSDKEVYAKVLHSDPALLVLVEPPTAALIGALLQKLPEKRLVGREAVGAAPFFDGFDWEALRGRRMRPPYVPRLAHATDTSNVIQVDKYARCSSEADGALWDRHLSTALLKAREDPFRAFPCDVWSIDNNV